MKTKKLLNIEKPPAAKPLLADGALSWWNSMTFEEQFYKTIAWLKDQNRNVTERHPHHLTGREIQQIYELHYA